MSIKLARSVVPTVEICPNCHLQVQRMSFENEAHVQTMFGGVATHSLHSQVSSTSTISLTCQSWSVTGGERRRSPPDLGRRFGATISDATDPDRT